ncbi:MAG: GIY-YIG nuclease family protein [Patescibacteria group bacterium]
MHGVYILRSKKDGDLYIGYSHDIKRRLKDHNDGKVPATDRRRPLQMIYCELFINRKDAMRRELYLKSGWGRKYLAKVLHETLSI